MSVKTRRATWSGQFTLGNAPDQVHTKQSNKLVSWLTALATTFATGWLLTYTGVTSFSFSLNLNFCLMIWFTVVENQLTPLLRSAYFNEQPFEKGGRIYVFWGVSGFRWLLRFVGWEKATRPNFPAGRTRSALQQCERSTRVSELGHTLIALIVLGVTVYVWAYYSFAESIWLLALNILLNLYPILVQRYNRPRYRRAIRALRVSYTQQNQPN